MTTTEAEKLAAHLLNTDDERIRDKRGPAGAIPVDDGTWLFLGYAAA